MSSIAGMAPSTERYVIHNPILSTIRHAIVSHSVAVLVVYWVRKINIKQWR